MKPLGIPFDGTGFQEQPSWSDTGGGGAGIFLHNPVYGLTSGPAYHWRMRLRYDTVSVPLQSGSRWLTGWWNGPRETDLRTLLVADASVTISDSPDPMIFGGPDLAYTIEVRNNGPGATPIRLQHALPSGVSLISATPSQGTCLPSGSTVTCDFVEFDSGGLVTVSEIVRPGLPATFTTSASILMPGFDPHPDPNNNSASERSHVLASAAGDRVWLDSDGDGIQDAGEPGFAGAAVAVYESASGAPIDGDVSDANGVFQLVGLTYGTSYYMVYFPPPGYTMTAAHQGSDDTQDSDADPSTWWSPAFAFTALSDFTRWDAGLVPACAVAPDEPIYLYMVTLSTDGNDCPILHFMDANHLSQVTGYNIYRSGDPSLPHGSWPKVASDIIDMDEATPNKQWVDSSGEPPPAASGTTT